MFPRNLTGRRKWGIQGKLVGATQPPPPTPCTPNCHPSPPAPTLTDPWQIAEQLPGNHCEQIHRADVLGPHAGLYPWLSLILSELQVGLKDGCHLTSPAGLLAVPLYKAFQTLGSCFPLSLCFLWKTWKSQNLNSWAQASDLACTVGRQQGGLPLHHLWGLWNWCQPDLCSRGWSCVLEMN